MKQKYEENLKNITKELFKCHKSKNISSCYNCIEFSNCSIRKDYVKSVYDSMGMDSTKGEGFNF